MFAFISPARLGGLISKPEFERFSLRLELLFGEQALHELSAFLPSYTMQTGTCREIPDSLTVSRRSVTQREKATDVFSPFLVVGSKTSPEKCLADLSDTPPL